MLAAGGSIKNTGTMKKIIQILMYLLVTSGAFAQDKKTVASNEFEKGIADKNAIIIDVRRPEEFKSGHIKGAINANWQNLDEFTAKTATLDKSKPVYVYCLGGVRSDKAADFLLKNGFKQVTGLDGGIKAWTDAGKLVTKPQD
jgi:rhodanese-related sulfurtransferase